MKSTRICTIEECGNPHKARGFCTAHYARWRKTGAAVRGCAGCGEALDTSHKGDFCGDDCRPRCAVDGCNHPKRYSDGYCNNHSQIVKRHGVPVGVRQWSDKAEKYTCIVCGKTFRPNGTSRQFCHANCQALHHNYRGEVPSLDFTCAVCEVHIEWTPGAWRRRDRKICDRCHNSGRTRHKTSPGVLAKRDGTDCRLCGKEVNMSARWPAPDSASVDHIVPVSHGGSHDLDNLQLSHWSCNHKKRNRLDYVTV